MSNEQSNTHKHIPNSLNWLFSIWWLVIRQLIIIITHWGKYEREKEYFFFLFPSFIHSYIESFVVVFFFLFLIPHNPMKRSKWKSFLYRKWSSIFMVKQWIVSVYVYSYFSLKIVINITKCCNVNGKNKAIEIECKYQKWKYAIDICWKTVNKTPIERKQKKKE